MISPALLSLSLVLAQYPAKISAVNYSEVLKKAIERGAAIKVSNRSRASVDRNWALLSPDTSG